MFELVSKVRQRHCIVLWTDSASSFL